MNKKKRLIIIFMVIFHCFNGYCYSQNINRDKAVKAILGEAEDQGYKGMLAVAVGIRNRNTLKGVYGHKANRPNTTGAILKKYWKQAEKAWDESKMNRIHTGTHWENIKTFKKPYWTKYMEKVYEYKDHTYYKRK